MVSISLENVDGTTGDATDSEPGLRDVLIVNAVALNGGDAAILEAVIASVSCAFAGKARIAVLDKYPDVSRVLYPEYRFHSSAFETCRRPGRGLFSTAIEAARIANLMAGALALRLTGGRRAWFGLSTAQWNLLELYRRSAVVVNTGGTMFVEKYNLVPRALDVWLGYLFAKPVVMFTQSFEPVRRRFNRLLMRSILMPADLVLVRGALSQQVAHELGVPESRLFPLPDSVFRFNRPVHPAASTRPPRLYVSVRYWGHAKGGDIAQSRYRAEIARFCMRAVREWDARVVFVSTCQGVAEYPIDDAAEAKRIMALIGEAEQSNVSIDREFHRPEQLMDLFAAGDVVIATRLHACILALCAGVPTVPISYERKTEEVFGRLLPGGSIQRFETIDADMLFAQVEEELDNRSDRVALLGQRVAQEAIESRRADALLRNVLGA